jgi:hypothetical protein
MAKKSETYVAGQTVENKVVIDKDGKPNVIQRVVYEKREVVEGYEDIRLPKKHRYNNGGFITIFQSALQAILQHGKLGKNEMLLLLWVIATAGVDGSVETNLDLLSAELGIKKPNVSSALKGLVQRNIIIRKDGNRYDRSPLPMELTFNYDQINYNLAYNGKTSQFSRHKANHPSLEVKDIEGGWVPLPAGADYEKLEVGQGVDLFTGEIVEATAVDKD